MITMLLTGGMSNVTGAIPTSITALKTNMPATGGSSLSSSRRYVSSDAVNRAAVTKTGKSAAGSCALQLKNAS